MTTRSDFDDGQWELVLEGPMTAGMIVITAASGGTFKETFAMARAYAEARQQHGQSALLDAIVAAKPKFDRHRYHSNQELHDKGLERIGEAAGVLREKATPEECDAYAKFVLGAATHAASAHKENGQEVSPAEQKALDEIRERLEASPAAQT